MSLDMMLNALNAVIILGASIPSAIMATRISNPKLRRLSILLAAFFAMHGFYHLSGALNAVYQNDILDFLTDGFLEPLSYVILLAFGGFLYLLGE